MIGFPNMAFEPSPDFNRIDKVLRKKGVPDKIPLFELFSNIQEDVLNKITIPVGLLEDKLGNMDERDASFSAHIKYMYCLGYDYINCYLDEFKFPLKELPVTDTKEGKRAYMNEECVTIEDRKDFEEYSWPVMSKVDYSRFERFEKYIPDGMKVIANYSGILENTMWLLGFQGISYLLHDDEKLVKDVFEAVGSRIIEYFDKVAAYNCVGAVVLGEDMGFNTSTMLSPAVYRKYLFPYHKSLVDKVHKHGKPIALHSCGNLSGIMDDIIECGWDAKHSFEDSIEPVWKAKAGYGDKIALLGGFDMDKIARMSENEVREHTRVLFEICSAGGNWAMGTGNSVPNYVPTDNFIAMIEQTHILNNNINTMNNRGND